MTARQDVELQAITVELGADDRDRARLRASRPTGPTPSPQDPSDVLHGDVVPLGELGNGVTAGMTCANVLGLQPRELVHRPFDVFGAVDGQVLWVEAAATGASPTNVAARWDRLAVGELIGDARCSLATVDWVALPRAAAPRPAGASTVSMSPEVFRHERGHGVLIVVDLAERW